MLSTWPHSTETVFLLSTYYTLAYQRSSPLRQPSAKWLHFFHAARMLKFAQWLLGALLLNGGLASTIWVFFLAANRSAENYLHTILDLLLAGLVATLAIPLIIALSGRGKNAPQTTLGYVVAAACWVGYVCWFWHRFGSADPKIGD